MQSPTCIDTFIICNSAQCRAHPLTLGLEGQANVYDGNNRASIFGQEQNITTYNLARINMLLHIEKIVYTYKNRLVEERYSLRVPLERTEKEDYNLNICRCGTTSIAEKEIHLAAVHAELVTVEQDIKEAKDKHNELLKELRLPLLPWSPCR